MVVIETDRSRAVLAIRPPPHIPMSPNTHRHFSRVLRRRVSAYADIRTVRRAAVSLARRSSSTSGLGAQSGYVSWLRWG